ncbi:Rv0361 family membrane protein [Mycolicibacterium thermoresistibile]
MSEQFDGAEDRPTATPFLGALVIVVGVVIIIGLINLFDREPVSPEQEIIGAVIAQNDALQRQDYEDFREFTCAAQHRSESEILEDQRNSVERRGERYLDDVADVTVSGERATARATYHFDNAPDDEVPAELTFVREDGSWKVCSPGPR